MMKKLSSIVLTALTVAATFALADSAAYAQTTSYYNSGFYDYTVGAGVTTLDVTLAGAFGTSTGSGSGGNGGLITARLTGLTAGQVLHLSIGSEYGNGVSSNGSGGAGVSGGGRGGELSAIAFGTGTNLSSFTYLLVAGGGGGANGGNGGAGGGSVGQDGDAAAIVGNPVGGKGGTQTAGGAPGASNATAGSFLKGGDGGSGSGNVYQDTGGGGGGGYYGGGGASGTAGGGGGSSYGAATVVNGVAVNSFVDVQGGAQMAQFGEEGQTSLGSLNGAGYATLTVVTANISSSAAPEPSSVALVLPALGMVGGGLLRRRRQK